MTARAQRTRARSPRARGGAPHVRRQEQYDAIVVGSGITGGWAAKELTGAGMNTLVLEAGPMIVPERDYVEHIPPYQMPFRGLGDRRALDEEQPIQKECYACDEPGRKFFVNDRENPYTHDDDKPFLWIRGRQVGGRSIMWARQSYRLSDFDFEANVKDGIAIDWPIRYADLAPWYDRVEEFIGVSGRAEGLPQLPDGRFLPPMEMACVEKVVRDAIARHFGATRRMTIGRSAVLTRDHNGRAACHYCGPCHRGCITRSYFSSLTATLPAAEATGNLTLRPDSVVHSVIWDPRVGRVTGVRVIDRETREPLEFFGRIVFLAASALESTRILLNSTSRRLSRRPGQLQRRPGPLPDGPHDECRRDRHLRGLGSLHLSWRPAERDLHPALQEHHRAIVRFPARLRISGLARSRRLVPGGG